MTQSGQGGEQQLPAARPAHEGVVLPADGGAPWTPGAPPAPSGEQAPPAGGAPWGQSQPGGPPQGSYGYPPAQPLPPAQPQPGQGGYQQPGAYQQPQGHYGYPPQQPPPQQGGYPSPYPQQPPPHQQPPAQQPYAQPLPPEAVPGVPGGDADATQFIAPVPGGPGPVGPPPGAPGDGSDATQYIPPVPGGPGPAGPLPGAPAAPGGDADATQFIAPVPGGPGPVGPPPGAPGGESDVTQYIPPVPGGAPYGIRPGAPGDRQPPAEFDNLFRSEQPAGATQQMPQVGPAQPSPQPYGGQEPPAYPQQGHPPRPHPGGSLPPQAPGGPAAAFRDGPGQDGPVSRRGGGKPGRRGAHVPLIAGVVVGCAAVGLAAGALLSGGDDEGKKDDKQPVAAQSSPAAAVEPTPEAPADPAKPQAEALDKLLADSNNSRAAVISAVEKIKSCKELEQADTDLKGAAQQRRDLVTRLGELTLDELPKQAELTASLNRAWKASAAADEHYAAWARQARKNKSVCKGGRARSTNETARANQQSGVATQAKREASRLWNEIAQKYGLTEHAYTEL